MPTAAGPGAPIHWDSDGDGPPLLLIMGAGFSSRLWYPVIPSLTETHRVIWFDNRGTGGTPTTAVCSIEDMAADAAAVLDAAGVDAADVYGISLGGVVALQLALSRPTRVRSLVLGCTGIWDDSKRRPPRIADLRFRLSKPTLVKLARKALYGPHCPEPLARADMDLLIADRTDRVGLVAQQQALRDYSVDAAQIASIDVPALVLHGTEDPIAKLAWAKQLVATLPDSRLITYPGAGHNYLVTHREQANRDVQQFLAA